jgi:hypothetical protein
LDFLLSRRRISVQEGLGREDHARRAIAALNSPLLDKGLLNRVESMARGQTFDGGDGLGLGFHGQT